MVSFEVLIILCCTKLGVSVHYGQIGVKLVNKKYVIVRSSNI